MRRLLTNYGNTDLVQSIPHIVSTVAHVHVIGTTIMTAHHDSNPKCLAHTAVPKRA